jgi:hypothetical protein
MKVDDYMRVLRTVTPHMVIPANDNGPRPAKPYLSVSLLASEVSGIHRGRNRDGERTNAQHRNVTMRVEVFGDEAWNIASALGASIFDEQAIDVAAELYGIAWLGSGRLMDVPQLRDKGGYEPRVVLEVPSVYTAHHVENVGAIEAVAGEMRTAPGVSALRAFVAAVVEPDAPPVPVNLYAATGPALAAAYAISLIEVTALEVALGRAFATGRVTNIAQPIALDSSTGAASARSYAAHVIQTVALQAALAVARGAGHVCDVDAEVVSAMFDESGNVLTDQLGNTLTP